MRFVVLGAGSVGGVVGARLFQQGHEVVLVARGPHYDAIHQNGLRVESADGDVRLSIPVADSPSRIHWAAEDVVILAVKTQDTLAALDSLAAAAPATVPVLCVQNGVANEQMALRRFAHVYGVYVWCSTSHLVAGVVQAWSSPMTGVLDIGVYPTGIDPLATAVAEAFRSSTFFSTPRTDVMRWKYRKLLSNLGNAVEALCGSTARSSAVLEKARREGVACLVAAGIPFAGEEEEYAEREALLRARPIDGDERPGGSTWQSLARARGSVECDYLNGEIVLLGRLHGVPTPVNDALQRLVRLAAAGEKAPGSMSPRELESIISS
jgi:2-dehydropantoate 2-reductase